MSDDQLDITFLDANNDELKPFLDALRDSDIPYTQDRQLFIRMSDDVVPWELVITTSLAALGILANLLSTFITSRQTKGIKIDTKQASIQVTNATELKAAVDAVNALNSKANTTPARKRKA